MYVFWVTEICIKNGDSKKKEYFTHACRLNVCTKNGRKYVSNSKKYFEVNPITKTQDKTRLNVCVFV